MTGPLDRIQAITRFPNPDLVPKVGDKQEKKRQKDDSDEENPENADDMVPTDDSDSGAYTPQGKKPPEPDEKPHVDQRI